MSDLIFLPTILLVNMGDKASRDMMESMTGEEIASFMQIIDVSNPHDLERLDYWINEESLPFVFSAYPSAWVVLGPEFTYVKDRQTRIRRVDNIVGNCDFFNSEVDRINDPRVLDGKSTYYQWVRNRALEEMIGVITEDRMMSHAYKLRYIHQQIALCSEIPAPVAAQLCAIKDLTTLHTMYYRFCKENVLQRQRVLESTINEEVGVNLGESIKLSIPAPRVPIPAGVRKNA